MCTASHNPKAYTGAKMVKRGAIALSGDAGIQDVRRTIEAGLGEAARWRVGGGRRRLGRVPRSRPALHRAGPRPPAEAGRRRRQRDGRADGRAAADPAGPGPGRDLLEAGRQLPRPRAQPAPAGEPPLHRGEGPRDRRRPGHRVGRRRRPLLLHRRHGPVRRRRLPDRAARGLAAAQAPWRGDPLRRARQPGRARHRRAGRRHGVREPRRPRLLQDADGRRRARSSAARYPATTTSATSTAPTPGRSRRC